MKLCLAICMISLVSSEYHNIHVQDHCDEINAVININKSISYGYVLDSLGHNYQPGKTCSVMLKAEPAHYHITIRFLFVDIYNTGKDNVCVDDYLKISGESSMGSYFCGSPKLAHSYYSKSNFLNFTFHTVVRSPSKHQRGFRIVYTRYHDDECDDSEYLCPFRDRCIPMEVRCDHQDNCGDNSDERYCSALSAIGTIMLSSCISLAILMVVILLCICVVKVLFGKKHRDRRSSSTSVPISTVDQPNQNAGVTCAGISMPQAAPGTANPYNEPPPSYYYVHYSRTDEKDDIDGGTVSINPSSSSISPSCDNQGVIGDRVVINQSPIISDGRKEAVNKGFVGDNKTESDQPSAS